MAFVYDEHLQKINLGETRVKKNTKEQTILEEKKPRKRGESYEEIPRKRNSARHKRRNGMLRNMYYMNLVTADNVYLEFQHEKTGKVLRYGTSVEYLKQKMQSPQQSELPSQSVPTIVVIDNKICQHCMISSGSEEELDSPWMGCTHRGCHYWVHAICQGFEILSDEAAECINFWCPMHRKNLNKPARPKESEVVEAV